MYPTHEVTDEYIPSCITEKMNRITSKPLQDEFKELETILDGFYTITAFKRILLRSNWKYGSEYSRLARKLPNVGSKKANTYRL